MIVKILRGTETSMLDDDKTFNMEGLLAICEQSDFDKAKDQDDTVTVRFKYKKDIPRWYVSEGRKLGYDPYEYTFYKKDLDVIE